MEVVKPHLHFLRSHLIAIGSMSWGALSPLELRPDPQKIHVL